MDEILKALEKKIRVLIDQHHQLVSSNQQLYQTKYLLVCEKDMLVVKQHKAVKQIEELIAKLKTLEE